MPKIIATAEVTNDQDKYLSHIRINKHELLVDEPLSSGGDDLGPAPGDYVCAALASCKTITLRMYIQRKKWHVDEIKVTANLVLGKDSASGNNTFFCKISFKGELDNEQQKRLLVIANSCPLHKMLSKPNDIVTSIV